MSKRLMVLAAATSLSLAAFAQTPQTAQTPILSSAQPTTLATVPANANALSEEQIKTAIADAGYKVVKGLEFDDGVWRTEARGGNERWVDLVVAPATGKVYPEDAPSNLNAEEVQAAVVAAGYQDVNNVEFDEGLWSVDAENAKGLDVDLLVDPDNATIVAERRD